MAEYLPYQFGQDIDDALMRAEVDRMERAAYPQPIQQPTYKPVARDHRIGRFNINGGALDSATLAVLQAMQNAPRATSGAGGFAQGLVSGFAGARGRQIGQRQKQYERDEQRAADEAEERRRSRSQAGASLANRRWDLYKEQKLAATRPEKQMFELPDGTKVPMTAAIASGIAKKQGVIPTSVSVQSAVSPDVSRQAKAVARAIVAGRQPPKTTNMGRGGLAGEVRRILEEDHGYDLATAEQDFDATKTFLRSANNPLSTRMRGSAMTAFQSTRLIDSLSDQLLAAAPNLRSPLSPLNNLTLKAAMNSPNAKVRSLARQLDAQIATVVFELGNVNMGGNSPTDQGMKRAAKELSTNWDHTVLKDLTALARENLSIRLNSINNVGAYTTKGIDIREPEGQHSPPAETTTAPVKGNQNGRKFLEGWNSGIKKVRGN